MSQQPRLFEDESPRLERLSFTKVELYMECPRRFKRHYVDGLPHKRQGMFYLAVGRAVHNALAELACPGGSNDDDVAAVLRRNWSEASFESPDKSDEWFDRAVRMVGDVLTAEATSPERVHMVETPFKFPFGVWLLTGRMDRVDKLEDGSFEIIDYKVGSDTDVPSISELALKLQWVFYWLALARQYRLEPSAVSFWYLAAGQRQRFEPDQGEVERAVQLLREVVTQLSTDETFVPRPNRECMSCLFAAECPAR